MQGKENVLKISDDTGQIVEYDTKTWQEKPMPIHVKDMLPEVGALVFYYVYTPNVRIREYEYICPDWAINYATKEPRIFEVIGYSKGRNNFRDQENKIILRTMLGNNTPYIHEERLIHIFSKHIRLISADEV